MYRLNTILNNKNKIFFKDFKIVLFQGQTCSTRQDLTVANSTNINKFKWSILPTTDAKNILTHRNLKVSIKMQSTNYLISSYLDLLAVPDIYVKNILNRLIIFNYSLKISLYYFWPW